MSYFMNRPAVIGSLLFSIAMPGPRLGLAQEAPSPGHSSPTERSATKQLCLPDKVDGAQRIKPENCYLPAEQIPYAFEAPSQP
jgi:hypothetical protein